MDKDTQLIFYALALIMQDGKLLMTFRKNVPWFDEHYGLPGGKVELNESASDGLIRELYEELGIQVEPDDLALAHTMHFKGERNPCVALFFRVTAWQGDIQNKEHDKVDHLAWFTVKELPINMVPRHKKALGFIEKGIIYSEDNW